MGGGEIKKKKKNQTSNQHEHGRNLDLLHFFLMKQAEMENDFSAWQIYPSGELNLQILYTFLLL